MRMTASIPKMSNIAYSNSASSSHRLLKAAEIGIRGESGLSLSSNRYKPAFSAIENQINGQITNLEKAERDMFLAYFEQIIPEICLVKDAGQQERIIIVNEDPKQPLKIEVPFKEDEPEIYIEETQKPDLLKTFKQGLEIATPEMILFLRNLFTAADLISAYNLGLPVGNIIRSASCEIKDKEGEELDPFTIEGFENLQKIWQELFKNKAIAFSENLPSVFLCLTEESRMTDLMVINFWDPLSD